MPPRDAKIQHMIDEINSLGRNLSHWEEEFMIDLSESWATTRQISEEDLRKLERLYDEKV